MNCEQAEEILSAYLDDALEPGLSEQVRAHLETCEHCREILEDYRKLDAELATAPMVAPDDSLRDRLFSSDEYKALLREQQEAADAPTEKTRRIIAALHPNSPLWSKALLPIAATVALALLLTVLARQGILPALSCKPSCRHNRAVQRPWAEWRAARRRVARRLPPRWTTLERAGAGVWTCAAADAGERDGRRVGGLAAEWRKWRGAIAYVDTKTNTLASDPQRRAE